jgi:hypothetical protein
MEGAKPITLTYQRSIYRVRVPGAHTRTPIDRPPMVTKVSTGPALVTHSHAFSNFIHLIES